MIKPNPPHRVIHMIHHIRNRRGRFPIRPRRAKKRIQCRDLHQPTLCPQHIQLLIIQIARMIA